MELAETESGRISGVMKNTLCEFLTFEGGAK